MQATLLITVLALGAPALKDKPANEASIVGDWVDEEITVNGKPLVATQSTQWRFGVDGKRALYRNGEWEHAGSYVLGRGSSADAMDLNSQNSDELCLCIYRLTGDTLILCVATSTEGRPKNFEFRDCTKYVFKRVTKKN